MAEARKAPPNPPVFDRVTARLHEPTRESLVWMVNERHIPVEIEYDDRPPGTDDAHHLRQRLFGMVEMQERPFYAAAVERGRGKCEVVGIPHDKCDRKPCGGMSARGLGDHCATDVHPDDSTARANEVRHPLQGLTRPTPDIKNLETFVQGKPIEHYPPGLLDALDGTAGVEEADKKAWVRLLIHGRKLCDI
jgi:hypothetical protein